jgi:hypothetical protein
MVIIGGIVWLKLFSESCTYSWKHPADSPGLIREMWIHLFLFISGAYQLIPENFHGMVQYMGHS